jgi:hypothetical protein
MQIIFTIFTYMLYRVILTKNGKYKKTLWRCKKRKTVFTNFHRIKEDNNVFFEREFINFKGIIPVGYMIYAVKDYEKGDKMRFVRNELGQVVEEKPIFGIWTVLTEAKYSIEESFWVYGFNPLTERKNIVDIIGMLMVGVNEPRFTKQIIVINNKLVFYNEDSFDMVICKCKPDAQRLHHELNKAARDNGIKNLYFMGTATDKKIMGDYYEIIHEKTGWNYTKIWRTTTRP